MASEELSLPRLPGVSWDEHSQSFSNNPRKRVRNSTSKHAPSPAFNNSSDPAIFSSDDDPALDNYVEGRRKKRYVGSWFQQHPTSSDSTFGGDSRDTIHVTKQRRAWSRQADSGVFLPSDGDGNESDDVMDLPEPPKPRLPQLNRVVRRVSKAEQMARDKVQACLDQGEETIDFWSMGLEDISNDTISPLSQFTCIPVVTKDVAFEQKDPELKIYMAMNRLTRVPGTIFDLTHLTILSLRHNKLTELPSAIAKLHNLKELNVSQNRLRHLPVELLDLFSSDNDLRTLVVHPNPFWQPGDQLEHVSEDQPDNLLFSYTPESESSPLPHLVSRVLGRSPLQLSNTTGRVISDFKFPTDHTKHILPVDDFESDSSTSSPVSAIPSSQPQASRVPSLLETALRACYQSAQLPEMPYYIPDGLTHLRKLLERAQRQKDAGGLTCSRCRKFMVIPTVEWVEWREIRTCKEVGPEAPSVVRMTPLSMAEGERTVPFVYRGCSWRCGPGDMDKASWGLPSGNLVPFSADDLNA